MQRLIKLLQERFDNWVYVYDETRAIKTGEQQFGLHFFRNHRYQKCNTNQSKFHWGHQFGALGLLCTTVTETILFPVWVKLICPKTHRDNSGSVLKRICSQIPSGLIIFDRGFIDGKCLKPSLTQDIISCVAPSPMRSFISYPRSASDPNPDAQRHTAIHSASAV